MPSVSFLTLYHLARKRLLSAADYSAFQDYQGELLVDFLENHKIKVTGQRVLDLACGWGGVALALQKNRADVIAMDHSATLRGRKVPFLQADALNLPFKSGIFDIVICSSLIEHVVNPSRLLEEIERILHPQGIAYLSFPPFYTPLGGHQFSPFHLLGENVALQIFKFRKFYQRRAWLRRYFPESPSSYSKAFGSWGLYPLTISKVEFLIKGSSFQIVGRFTKYSPINFSNLPWFREFLTWHVQYLLRSERTNESWKK